MENKDTKVKSMNKNVYWIVIFFSVAVIFLLKNCDSKYKKEITWAVYNQGYIVAVEIDDYNGDKIKAGTYSADVVHSSDGKKGVYDIYIFDHNIGSESELEGIDPDYTVGGMDSKPVNITVNRGEYVIIQPYKVLYNPSGYFEMKLN